MGEVAVCPRQRCRISSLARGVVAAILIFFLFQTGRRILAHDDVSDFRTFHAAAVALAQGRSPYQLGPGLRQYVYPPLLASALRPLTGLSAQQAAVLWLAANLLMFWAAARTAVAEYWRRLGGAFDDDDAYALSLLLAVLLCLGRFKSAVHQGETDILVLLMFVLALRWLDRRPILAGAALGLAFNIKYLTIGALPYLLLRRRWSAAAAFLASALVLLLLPASTLGLQRDLHYVHVATGGVLRALGVPTTADADIHVHRIGDLLSVSISSGLARYTRHRPALFPAGMIAVALAVCGWVVFCYRRSGLPVMRWPSARAQRAPPYAGLLGIEWAALVVLTLAYSPNTNTRHLVLALIPLSMWAVLIVSPRLRAPRRRLIAAGTLTCLLGMELFGATAGMPLKAWWSGIGGHTIAMLLGFAIALPGALSAAAAAAINDKASVPETDEGEPHESDDRRRRRGSDAVDHLVSLPGRGPTS